jgi:hypothetical protein
MHVFMAGVEFPEPQVHAEQGSIEAKWESHKRTLQVRGPYLALTVMHTCAITYTTKHFCTNLARFWGAGQRAEACQRAPHDTKQEHFVTHIP